MKIMRKEISVPVGLIGLAVFVSLLMALTVYAGTLSSFTVSPSNVHAGATSNYTINFTTATEGAMASSTLFTFPSGFGVSSLDNATSTVTWGPGTATTTTATTTVSNQNVVLRLDDAAINWTSTSTLSVTLTGIRNPSQDGSFTLTATTTNNTAGTGTTIDTGSATFVIQGVIGPAPADTAAPVSKITRPTAGATISAGESYVIEGTGSDESTVAKVEVSLDDGKTWSIAKSISSPGTFRWEYVWQNPTEGEYTIRVRATDSAGNIESPAAGVKVTVPAALVPAVPPEEVPEVVPEKPITEMTVQELQTKVAELQQTLINLLQQLVQLLQQQLQELLT